MKRFSMIPLAAGLLALTGCAADEGPQAPRTGAYWQISPEYISNTMLLSDDALDDARKSGQFLIIGQDDLAEGVFARYRQMAKRMKLRPLPALYADTDDTRPLPQAAARFTREGKPYILINRSARERWSARQLAAVLGHELVHLKERHVTAERIAEAYNHPEISVAHEMEADRVGSGPLGSCDPEALKEALEIVIDADRKDFLDKNPFKTPGDYNSLTGDDHPQWEQRKAALEGMIAHPPGGCR